MLDPFSSPPAGAPFAGGMWTIVPSLPTSKTLYLYQQNFCEIVQSYEN